MPYIQFGDMDGEYRHHLCEKSSPRARKITDLQLGVLNSQVEEINKAESLYSKMIAEVYKT